MDSFKVYQDSENSAYLNYPSVVRAYEAAFPALDRTVLAEMQGGTNYRGSVAVAANRAFDLGIATAAAAGNFGPRVSSIASPGNAQKVLAFGAHDIQGDFLLMSYSGRGPTEDGRVKPDLITPTNTKAADIHSGPSSLKAFGGTSGSSPYGAGAVALYRNFIRSAKSTPEPGLIYAMMINGGSVGNTAYYSDDLDSNDIGAGYLRMHTNGISFWGSVVVGSKHITIPLDTGETRFEKMKMSIWWPEEPNQSHKQFRVGFRNYQCGSWSGYWPNYLPTSVWQKYTSNKQCSGKRWYLQIIPENNLRRNRRVYYHVDFSYSQASQKISQSKFNVKTIKGTIAMKIFILSILLVLGALGCESTNNPDPPSTHKETCIQTGCSVGHVCENGSCVKLDESETANIISCTPECSSDSSCVNGTCIKNKVSRLCGEVECPANEVCDEDQETCRPKEGCELDGRACTPDSLCLKGKCVKVDSCQIVGCPPDQECNGDTCS